MVAMSHSTAIAAITTVRPAPLAVISIRTPAAKAAKPISEVGGLHLTGVLPP